MENVLTVTKQFKDQPLFKQKKLDVNGTGHKGNCSYANSNTGEITMHGINTDGSIQNTQSQYWSLEAKAGSTSRAKIVVN